MTIRNYVMITCDEGGCDSEHGPFANQREVRLWLRRSKWASLVRGTKTVGHRCSRHDEPPAMVGAYVP